jgi:glutamyl-tRNA synthetase
VAFLFRPAIEYDPADLVQKGMDAESTKLAMERATSVLESLPGFDTDAIEGALRPLAVDLGIKVGQLLGSIRVATTGQRVAPPLFEALEVLGRERSLAAMKEATRQL